MTVDTSSKTQATFYPASLMPPFMGAHPPTKLDTISYDGMSINYFQKYRTETLSKFSIPRYQWGMQEPSYGAQPEIIATTKRRNINRDLMLPSNDISTIDVIRMKEVDDLYKGIQIHRSQYKDRTGTFHPLTYFKPDYYKYQCAPGMTTSYITKYPENYISYKTPIVLPLTYGRRKEIPNTTDLSLSGIYNKTSCIAYKR
ncbi:ciliary microtubule inner protein 2C-like [Osmia lignaria lignaria]|uniref:ciliary microtubule inner protein 2C-like n=1 Tax=Osmia lignaria lignaria TaxID=1437193 RepID=UPI00147968E6|nr:protein FAM166C A-like [Osmia lignaria]